MPECRQELFGNTGGREFQGDFDLVGGRLHNRLTDTFPVVLHCPGKGRFQGDFGRLAAEGWQTPVDDCGIEGG